MNKRKLSKLITVGLCITSCMHSNFAKAAEQSFTDRVRICSIARKAQAFLEARNAQRILFEKASAGLSKALTPVSSAVAKIPSVKPFNNGLYAAVGAGVAGFMSGAEYLYDKVQSQVVEPVVTPVIEPVAPVIEPVAPVVEPVAPVVVPVGYTAKAQALFAQYANNEAIKNGLNSVVTGVKNHKQAVFGAAGLATFIGAMKAYDYYTTKPESTTTSQEKQTSAVKQVAPVVEQAPVVEKASVVEKMTVQEIAAKYTSDPSDMLKAFRAHGYTKADVSQHTLKRLTKLNDGQCRFVVSRLS